MPETPPAESELHPDDLIAVERLAVKCSACGGYLDRRFKQRKGEHLVFLYLCPASQSHRAVLLQIPCTTRAVREVSAADQLTESELHPDDGFSIAGLDVKIAGGGHSKRSAQRPDGASLADRAESAAHDARLCHRSDKELVEIGRTTYLFVAGDDTVEVLVPQA